MKTLIFICLITILSCTKTYRQTDLNELEKYGTPIAGHENPGNTHRYIMVFKDSMNVITEVPVSEAVYGYYYNSRIK